MNKKTYNAEARGFISGYLQVFFDEMIEDYQLVEGLSYWDIDLDEIKASGILFELELDDRQKVEEAFMEAA